MFSICIALREKMCGETFGQSETEIETARLFFPARVEETFFRSMILVVAWLDLYSVKVFHPPTFPPAEF